MPHPLVVHVRTRKYDVYIGRGRCPLTGERPGWGNPFEIGKDGDRAEVIWKYRNYLRANPAEVTRARRELAGKVLACWCAPRPCHGDVLAELANGAPLVVGPYPKKNT